MRSLLSLLGCLRALFALAFLLLLCFVAGLALQVGWQSYQGQLIIAPTPVPPAPPSLTPTARASATASLTATATTEPSPTPTRTPRATTTPRPTTTPRLTATVVVEEVPAETVEYTVAEGDTLVAIAERFGITVTDIIEANPDLNPNIITVGQTLRLPQP